MKKTLLLFSTIAIVLFSCKKDNSSMEEQSFTSSIVDKSAAEQVKYAETNLKKIANGIAKLAKNPAFVQYMHNEVAQKFDGQFEVLIEHLLLNPTWGSQLRTQEVKEGVAAFKNLKGQNFYPQIYIPKMQNDEDNQVANVSNNTTSNDDVKVVIYGGEIQNNTSSDILLGYNINEDGELVAWQNIGESYANGNEVWVFSLNEVLDPSGRLAIPEDPICNIPDDPQCSYGGGGGGTSGGGGTNDSDPAELGRGYHPEMGQNTPVNCRIQNMKVKHHKERWAAGKSEVAIRAVLNTINGYSLGNINSSPEQYVSGVGKTSYLGKLIRDFTRSEVNDQDLIAINFTIQTQWPTTSPNSDPVYFDYVIFERDLWPTGKNHLERFDFNVNPFYSQHRYNQFYRSADDAYFVGRVTTKANLTNGINSILYSNGFMGYYSIDFNTISF
jgi:hypothetical protein